MRYGRLLIVSVAVLLATGCGGGTGSSSLQTSAPTSSAESPQGSSGSSATQRLVCSASILAHPPLPDRRVLRGAVGLQSWPATRLLQAVRDGTPGRPRLFAKTGLVIRAERPATITVHAPPAAGRARIGWANSTILPAHRVVVPACPATDHSRWLTYPGGYWVDHPACVRVTVRSRGGAETIRVPVGSRCH